MEEQKVVRKKRNYKSRRFWMIYAICMLILVACVIVINIKVWDVMLAYEKTQPEYVLDDVLEDITAGNIEVTVTSPYEDAGEYAREAFMERIEGKELSYMLDASSYDQEAPVYDILVEDETVCKVTLQGTNKRSMMAILSVYDWEVTSVEPVLSSGMIHVQITVPSAYTVTVNGVTLADTERVGEPVELTGFEETAAYTATPTVTTYAVTGLYREPEIRVYDAAGLEVDIPEEAELSELVVDYAESEPDEEMASYVLANAETYMNYFSRDLSGCYESTAPIAYMFPSDSYYLNLAEMYRTGDMWMYSKHDTPVFFDETVSHYTVYSEELFTVEVSFKRSMILQNAARSYREEENDKIYQYVLVDGQWVIANMIDQLGE